MNRGGSSEIYDLSWSPDSQYIFSGSVDNTACIWDVIQGNQNVPLIFKARAKLISCSETSYWVQGAHALCPRCVLGSTRSIYYDTELWSDLPGLQVSFANLRSKTSSLLIFKRRKNKSIKNNSFHCVKVLKKRQINKPQIALKNDQTPSAQTNDASVTAVPATVVTDNINNVSVDAQVNKTATDHKMFLDETVKS